MSSYPELAQKVDLYLERVTPFGFSGALLIARRNDGGACASISHPRAALPAWRRWERKARFSFQE